MTSLPTSFVADMEIANGAEPLDILLAELDESESEWADGASLYGAGGLFNDKRKSLLSVIALRIRDERAGAGLKSTEDLIDQLSHADKEYVKFLDSHIGRRAKWLALDAHRDSVVMKVSRGQAMLRIGARMSA